MAIVAEILDTAQRGFLGWVFVFLVLTVFELLNGKGEQPLSARVHGLAFWTLSIPVSAVVMVLYMRLWQALGMTPLLAFPVFERLWWLGPFAAVAAALAAAVLDDFFFYWFHRAQHRFFWRFHAVHHSIRDLSAVNSYHHGAEALFAVVLHTLPASLIVTSVGPGLPLVGLALWLHIVWIHSPTRAHLGPLRSVFVDNRFHRIHHSLEERHFDKNFGAFTTLWDRLFGTAHFPERDEWPDVGLSDMAPPNGVGEWIAYPTRRPDADAAPRPAEHPVPAHGLPAA